MDKSAAISFDAIQCNPIEGAHKTQRYRHILETDKRRKYEVKSMR